jgi:hypothetical protein
MKQEKMMTMRVKRTMPTLRQVIVNVGAACALAMACGTTWAAPFSGEAVLAAGVVTPAETEIDGVKWRCEGDKCLGKADYRSNLDSHMKECRKVAATFGALTSYSSRGRTLSKGDIETCNRLAAKSK